MVARYVHTNLVARDWRELAAFYCAVFGCRPVPPERKYSGEALERGTGVAGAALEGVHLALPGYDEGGPTLEIFTYSPLQQGAVPAPNRTGFGHIAFAVDSVAKARYAVLVAGGKPVGEIVTLSLNDGRRVEWCYVSDPEGNIVELQCVVPGSP
ncbi:MAG: VOC family protein [Acidobacteria bacterium]|nr:VOC family protein [Acidobacteriota bacterium]